MKYLLSRKRDLTSIAFLIKLTNPFRSFAFRSLKKWVLQYMTYL
jgi:hypothetical protein